MMRSLDSYIYDMLRLSNEGDSATYEIVIDLMRFITHLGDLILLVFISIITLVALIRQKFYKIGLFWTVTVLFSFLFSAGLKKLIGRERPDDIYHLVEATSAAMPSGHALKSTVVYFGLYLLLMRVFRFSKAGKIWTKLLCLMPFLIGSSRIFLGVHWPSDVLAGWCLGALISLVFYRFILSHS